jgi:hypothetical protein
MEIMAFLMGFKHSKNRSGTVLSLNIIPDPHLPLFHRKALFQHDDSIATFTLGRLITELRRLFENQMDVPISFLNDNLY